MTDTSKSTPSLAEVVQAGIAQGADSDRITRIAEQVFVTRGWTAAQRRQFRDQVAGLIARYRHPK